MEENSELEGEAHCYKGDKHNIDPDTDLSYIDEKVQNILGHHRKDFEGGVSKEILGAKFGGYGSFLPSHERYLSKCSYAKTPQSDSNTPISQNNLSMEGTFENFQPISNVSSFMKFGTVSCSDHSLQNSGVLSGEVPVKHDFQLSSAQVAEKFNIKDECSSRSRNLTNQRKLRVRIKVNSNKMARNMDIYSGLGLDYSPSLSLGNSAKESGGTNPVSRETADESLTSILQVMTSFPVPGGVLLSPLHDSLFCLIRKERLSRDSERMPSLKGSQEHSAVSLGKPVACLGNQKLLKEKRLNLLGKSARPVQKKNGSNAKDQNDTAFLKKKLENETPGGKETSDSNASRLSLLNSECVLGSVKGMGRASEVSSGVDKDEVSRRWFLSNLVREDSLESISGQDSSKSEKNGKSRLVERVSEHRGLNSHHEVLGYIGESAGYKGKKKLALIKARSGATKCNDDSIVPSKQKVSKKPSIQVQDESKLCYERRKPPFEGKKSKGSGLVTTSYGASTCKSKMQKLKSQKDINKDRVICKDSLAANLEQTNNQLERPSNSKPSKKVDGQVRHEPSIKDAPFMVPSTIEGRHGTEMVLAGGDPVDISENWVCCDNCQTWRLLPSGILPEHLPENWLCSMLNWLPGMNRCDFSEEETTKALFELYQLPENEGLNNVQNYANGLASVTALDHGQHIDQKHQSPDSAAVSIQAKKRFALKGLPKAGDNGGIQINTTKSHLQDSVKSRSLNDMNQCPAESNVMKRLSSCNSDFDKSITKQKEEQMNGGDSKKLKMKKKRDADQHGCGSSKKAKIEDIYASDGHRNSVVGRRKVALKPNTGLQTEAGGKNILNELSYSEDAKCETKDMVQLSRKKLGDQARVSSNGGSLNARMQDKRNNSETKSKWQDYQNGHASKEYAKEECSKSGLGREKKSRVQKTGGRDLSANKGAGDKSNIVASLFSTKGYVVDSRGHAGGVDKGLKNQKHRRDFASQQTSNAVDSVRRDFGFEVSVPATSSTSKVSDYCKNRADFEDVKVSPVESVSSSPFRTSYSYPDKLTLATEDILGKDDGGTDCVLVNNNFERFLDGEGNGEINQSGTVRKKKDSSNFHPQIISEGENWFPERSRSKLHKDEKNHISRRDCERKMPSDGRMEKQVIVREQHDSDVKLQASTDKEVASQGNLIQDLDGDVKATQLERETINGMSKMLSSEREHGHRTGGCQSVPGSHRGGMFNEVLINDPCKADVSKSSKYLGNVDNKNEFSLSWGNHSAGVHGVKDLNASIPRSMKSSGQNATIALKEAKELRDYADRLKSSGFDFESNEVYFQSALKFFLGASLLETCNGESRRNGEMTQFQAYRSTVKLCEFCGHEYERRQEMAAASLAYKCMEVACMRVVYCKQSSTSRDRIELQATLHMTALGESPSSSASDVDNLNNQMTADKAALSKGMVSHVTGNHVIVPQNRPNFIRLLDFTQDVDFAMKASKKSQDAFTAASVPLEEGQNTECLTIIKRVIDFSFQDVEGFLNLVRLAKEAINRSGYGISRD